MSLESIESKLTVLSGKIALLENNKIIFSSKYPNGIDAIAFPTEDSLGPSKGGGYLSWNFNPLGTAAGTIVPTGGTIYVMELYTTAPISVSTIHMYVSTVGSGLVAGQNLVAIYGKDKALLGTTLDQSVAWTSAYLKSMSIVGGPITVPVGTFYIAFFCNGTTKPSFLRAAATNVHTANGRLTGDSSNFASADTGRTTSMPSILGTFTAVHLTYWTAVS